MCLKSFIRIRFLKSYFRSTSNALVHDSVIVRIAGFASVFCLLLFPVSSTVLPVVPGVIIGVIIIGSLVLYFMRVGMARRNTLNERLFYLSVVFVVFVVIFTSVLSGIDSLSIKKIGKFVYLLMVVPVYFYFRTVRINNSWLWYGLVLGAFVSGLVSLYEVSNDVFKTGYFGRAKGATHPIIFGDLALLMGVMTLAGWEWFMFQSRWHLLLPIIAVFSGVLASVLSQSRGGWISVPVLMVIIVWFHAATVPKLKLVVGMVAIMGVFLIMFLSPQTGLKYRVVETVKNVQKYVNTDKKSNIGWSSAASRFEMWRASWLIFQQNPVIGVGWGGYQRNAIKFVKSGEVSSIAADHNHPHNQFFSAMVSGGALGLIAILILFYMPIKIFINVITSSNVAKEVQQSALAGLLLVIGYAVFNLSESLFERSRTIAFFIFYLAFFMAGINQQKSVIEDDRESRA